MAVLMLGARQGRYTRTGGSAAHPPSNIPFLALGAWVLSVGWFGFNVMSAQALDKISGLVAVNSLMAMAGGILAALVVGRNDPGFVHNGPLAGLVAICAGSDVMHPIGALATGVVAGALFDDDVLAGAGPLARSRRAGRMAAARAVRRLGRHRLPGSSAARHWAGWAAWRSEHRSLGRCSASSSRSSAASPLYGILRLTVGLRLGEEEEFNGADLTIHKITSTPERESG